MLKNLTSCEEALRSKFAPDVVILIEVFLVSLRHFRKFWDSTYNVARIGQMRYAY